VVILDSGSLTLNGGGFPVVQGLALGPLLTVFSDPIVVDGNVSTSGGGNNTVGGSSVIIGVLVVPKGTAQFTPGRVNGEVIGGAAMSFAPGGQMHVLTPRIIPSVPEPASIALLATALFGFGIVAKKRIAKGNSRRVY
jgi:PEP-CTERM motif-containing protein